jgi:flagellar motor switch protein FliN/FliY
MPNDVPNFARDSSSGSRAGGLDAPAAASQGGSVGEGLGIDAVMRIPVLVQVVLGSATMPVASLMKLGRGAVVPLDHRVGEPVDVVVNGRVVARGEIVVMEEDDSRFGVSVTEILGAKGSSALS